MKFYVEEDGHGEPTIWAVNADQPDPVPVLVKSNVPEKYWDEVVSRMTGISKYDVVAAVHSEVGLIKAEAARTALHNVNDRAQHAARIQGAQRALARAEIAVTF